MGKPSLEMLKKASRCFSGYIIGGTVLEKKDSAYYNTCPVFKSGRLLASYRKINLVQDDRDLNVSPGKETVTLDTPFGRIGLLICADVIVTDLVEKVASKSDHLFIPMSLTDPNHPKYEGHPISVRIARKYGATVVGMSRVNTFSRHKLTSKSAVVTPHDGVIFEAVADEKLAVIGL